MFTGLVKEIGKVEKISSNTEGREIVVKSLGLIKDIEIDDSVSINGVCQTVTEVTPTSFKVQTVHVTLEKTVLGKLKESEEVNLELALRLSDRLGGHLVQGHVNGIGVLEKISKTGNNFILGIKYPSNISKYIVGEGSITIDGISLTVSQSKNSECYFEVSIIPHTFINTILKNKKIGDVVNLETDILAKYVENILSSRTIKNNESKITEEWLLSKGF